LRQVASPPDVACDRRVHGAGDRLRELACAVEDEPAPRDGTLARERRGDLRLRGPPDARRLAQPTRLRGLAELLGCPHPERAPELDHPLRTQPGEPAEADELRHHLPFELVELCDPAGLDELPEPRLYPGP